MRTDIRRPNSSVRLSVWTATSTSVTQHPWRYRGCKLAIMRRRCRMCDDRGGTLAIIYEVVLLEKGYPQAEAVR